MAQPYCTGPVALYANLAATIPFDETTAAGSIASNTVLFLGWGKEAPVIEVDAKEQDIESDLSGGVPYDVMFRGEEARISVTLSVYNEQVFQKLQARPRFSGTMGTGASGDVGTLIRTEGTNFCLYLVFPYATQKNAMSDLPDGYRFPSCYVQGPIRVISGTKENLRVVNFRALPVFANNGGYTLFDNNIAPLTTSGVANTPPTAAAGTLS